MSLSRREFFRKSLTLAVGAAVLPHVPAPTPGPFRTPLFCGEIGRIDGVRLLVSDDALDVVRYALSLAPVPVKRSPPPFELHYGAPPSISTALSLPRRPS